MTVITTIRRTAASAACRASTRTRRTRRGCTMRFGVFLPPQAEAGRVPVLYWLSGLTCTEENFIVKAGAQRVAAELGLGDRRAGHEPARARHSRRGAKLRFRPRRRILRRRDARRRGRRATGCIRTSRASCRRSSPPRFPVDPPRAGIFGHSMGGHGALTIALKNPQPIESVSAFAPIASPMRCPWGEKALTGYLGADRARWREYDATALIEDRGWAGPPIAGRPGHRAISSSKRQLKPELLQRRLPRAPGCRSTCGCSEGYDHSYFFIATFIEDHFAFTRATCTRDGGDRSVISARRRSRAHPAARARKGRLTRRGTLGRRHAQCAPWE